MEVARECTAIAEAVLECVASRGAMAVSEKPPAEPLLLEATPAEKLANQVLTDFT